jgi:hypothetical protein
MRPCARGEGHSGGWPQINNDLNIQDTKNQLIESAPAGKTILKFTARYLYNATNQLPEPKYYIFQSSEIIYTSNSRIAFYNTNYFP